MNDIIKHSEQHVLHFHRWSNSSFAIFNSIGRVVHIGFLSTIIQGLVTVKALIFHELVNAFPELTGGEELDEESVKQLKTEGVSFAKLFSYFLAPALASQPEGPDFAFRVILIYKKIVKACVGPFFIKPAKLFMISLIKLKIK